MSHPHSPTDVLIAALVVMGVGVYPNSATVPIWPIYADHLPELPDNALCLYDTTGVREGRIMRTGESIRHPGWQIRVRALDAPTAWSKVRAIEKVLDAIRQLEIVLDGERYKIAAVTQTGTPLPLGQETDAKRRDHITINGTITIKELES